MRPRLVCSGVFDGCRNPVFSLREKSVAGCLCPCGYRQLPPVRSDTLHGLAHRGLPVILYRHPVLLWFHPWNLFMVLFYCPPRGAWHESTHGVGDPVIVLQSWVDVFLVCGFRVSVCLVKCAETSAGCAVVPRLSVPTALFMGGVVFTGMAARGPGGMHF